MGRGGKKGGNLKEVIDYRKLPGLDTIPLLLENYSQEQLEEISSVVQAVLSIRPEPRGEDPEEVSPGEEALPDNSPSLIGISGKSRAGKDTVSSLLYGHYRGVARMNFSDPIINEVNAWLSHYGHFITEANKSTPEYRKLLQTWGLFRRGEKADYWTEKLQESIREAWEGGASLVVVCGVRTESDLELIEDMGGDHWRIERPGNTYSADHAVERALDNLAPSRVKMIQNPEEGDITPLYAAAEDALRA